jgi:CHAT domain-containing protein
LADKGNFGEAFKLLSQAEQLALRNSRHDQLAAIYRGVGNMFCAMGRFEEAKDSFEDALKTYVALLRSDPENLQYQSYVAGNKSNLGDVLRYMGRFEKAKDSFEDALKMFVALLRSDPENLQYQLYVAMAQSDLGDVLGSMGRFEKAKDSSEDALKMFVALLKCDPENLHYQLCLAVAQSNLSKVLLGMGRFEEAKDSFEDALKTYVALLRSDPENLLNQSNLAMTEFDLGTVLTDMGIPSEALVKLSEALNLVPVSYNPDLVSKIFGNRGRCHEKMNHLKEAFEDYEQSIVQIELIRSKFSLEEYKLDILRKKEYSYSDMVSLLCLKWNDADGAERAWEYVERAKSRSLLDYLRLVELPTPQNVPKNQQSKEKDLIESIRIFDRQARTTRKKEELISCSQKIAELQNELNDYYNQIQTIAPQYVELRRGKPLSIDGIRGLLKRQNKKAAFIEYYTSKEQIFVFLMLSKDLKPKVIPVPISHNQLLDCVQRYFSEVAHYQAEEMEETWLETANKLVAPVLSDIEGCEILYLIPHGLLHYLPLHALCIGDKRLIEEYQIIYMPSLTALQYVQVEQRKLDSCLAIGFTPNEVEKELFEGEALFVANLFEAKPHLGKDAVKKLLQNVDVDVVHLSTHSSLNPFGILLSDGILTVKETFGLNARANLLVLSACETGLNEQKPGDELVGFTRSFLYSGVNSIMVSLWIVRADSTMKLMEDFYLKMKDKNMSKAEALQKAQIELMRDEKYSHPYFWAPFILIGDWK